MGKSLPCRTSLAYRFVTGESSVRKILPFRRLFRTVVASVPNIFAYKRVFRADESSERKKLQTKVALFLKVDSSPRKGLPQGRVLRTGTPAVCKDPPLVRCMV